MLGKNGCTICGKKDCLGINSYGGLVFCIRCEPWKSEKYQPERSKREDSEKIDVNTRAWKARQEWNRRCGALNTTVTP